MNEPSHKDESEQKKLEFSRAWYANVHNSWNYYLSAANHISSMRYDPARSMYCLMFEGQISNDLDRWQPAQEDLLPWEHERLQQLKTVRGELQTLLTTLRTEGGMSFANEFQKESGKIRGKVRVTESDPLYDLIEQIANRINETHQLIYNKPCGLSVDRQDTWRSEY